MVFKSIARFLYYLFKNLVVGFNFNVVKFIKSLTEYVKDLTSYIKLNNNKVSQLKLTNLMPMLADKTEKTPIEPIYFYQDVWGASKVFDINPKEHVDIASSVKTMAVIAQKIPVKFVDIRPPDVMVKEMEYVRGSITQLPFKKSSLESLSSLCVIEHIGLGRYGDDIDPLGTEKAALEMQRVVKKNGNILISAPVDSDNFVYFNAHRAFTRKYILSLFQSCRLVEERYIYDSKMYNSYDKHKGFGVGLYHLRKK